MDKKKQYIVFGVGRFGSALSKKLCEMGHEVLAVDSNQERVAQVSPYVTTAIQVAPGDTIRIGERFF